MNEKRKFPLIEVLILLLLIVGGIFLVLKYRIFAKATENNQKPTVEPWVSDPISAAGTEMKPENEPTNAGTEKPTDFPTITPIFSVPPKAETSLPVFDPFSFRTNVGKTTPLPFERKRRQIAPEDLAKAFEWGARKLTLTEAVAELKKLGFGQTAAYAALLPDGRFSAWLHFAPDGTITWNS